MLQLYHQLHHHLKGLIQAYCPQWMLNTRRNLTTQKQISLRPQKQSGRYLPEMEDGAHHLLTPTIKSSEDGPSTVHTVKIPEMSLNLMTTDTLGLRSLTPSAALARPSGSWSHLQVMECKPGQEHPKRSWNSRQEQEEWEEHAETSPSGPHQRHQQLQ